MAFSDKHHATPRERDLLLWMAAGCCSSEELATRFGLSVHTINNHFKNLMHRLGTSSKAGVLAMFITHLFACEPTATPKKRYLSVADALKPERIGTPRSEHALSDEQWARIQRALPIMPPPASSSLAQRDFIDAVLYRATTGIAWRKLPSRFGPWKNVHIRFCSWMHRGLWDDIFAALQIEVED